MTWYEELGVKNPYYADDAVVLIHADCREVLPTLGRFDLLLTDPPYGIGEAAGKNKSRGCIAVSKDYGNLSWDSSISPVVYDAIKVCDKAIVFGGNYYELPPSSCWIVWDKDNGETDFADAELAWTNFKTAVRIFKYKWQGMLQGCMGTKKEQREHPTQKPLPLMLWCIENYSEKGKLILDPFAGSGTTGRACKDLGRKCVLIEREEKYCAIAARRMAQEVLF